MVNNTFMKLTFMTVIFQGIHLSVWEKTTHGWYQCVAITSAVTRVKTDSAEEMSARVHLERTN